MKLHSISVAIMLIGAITTSATVAACAAPVDAPGKSAPEQKGPGKNDGTSGGGGTAGTGNGDETAAPSASGAKAECLPATKSATGQGESAPNAAGQYLELEEADLFTGFDGTHPFQMPTRVRLRAKSATEGEKDAKIAFDTPPTLTVEDPSIIDVKTVAQPSTKTKKDVGQYVMVTAKKAGVTKLTAKYKDLTTFTVVHVQQYTPEQFEIGKQRYEKPTKPAADRKACTGCHNSSTGVTPGEKHDDDETISHDPTEMSYYPDEEIRVIATEGQRCEDGKKVPIPELARFGSHRWNFSNEELVGIVAYMRSLKPVGY